MSRRKLSHSPVFKFIAVILVHTFLLSSTGLAANKVGLDNSYLAPTINIQSGAVSSSIAQAIKDRESNTSAVSTIKPQPTGFTTVTTYLQELSRLRTEGYIEEVTTDERKDLRYELNKQRQEKYFNAIKEVLKERNVKVITPDILFEAAKRATQDDHSTIKARVGLQPGTINPLHYGHMSASLAGIIGRVQKNDKGKHVKVMTLIANGGTVPDKPFASSAEIRNNMAKAACKDPNFNEWAEVTPIRGQMVDMFMATPETIAIAGENENSRRFNMDMAAFIWLFVANPNVEWVYLVGSDKVADYGRKNEQGLLVETLSRPEAHATVVYFSREGEKIDYKQNIRPYAWLDQLWKSGFFIQSTVSSFDNLSASKIRNALVRGENQIDGKPLTESMSPAVSAYIRNSATLQFLYALEIKENAATKQVKTGKVKEGLALYKECIDTVKAELAKADQDKVLDTSVLDQLYLLVLADEIRALSSEGLLKNIPQIFLIYSAAPGTGKGELMDATFEKGKGRFADIIGKIILYHTRSTRVAKGKAEKDGIKYHFRSEKRLKELEAEGKIVTAWVNRQLQGLAINDFTEEGVTLEGVKNAARLHVGDVVRAVKNDAAGNIESITVQRGGKDEKISGVSIPLDTMYDILPGDVITAIEADVVTVDRSVKGLSTVFSTGKPVILEGGYGWFNSLIHQNPEILSIFIAPFADIDIGKRIRNTQWINDNFNKPDERLAAYRAMQGLIDDNKGEIDISGNESFQQSITKAVENERIAVFNAELIESDAFIQDLNDLLALFNKEPVAKKDYTLARSLAYEVNRRTVSRDGQLRFSRGKRPAFGEGESDPQFDRYNRVLEGVVQILHRTDYEYGRAFGKIVENQWGYTAEKRDEFQAKLINDFTRFFFESILKGIRVQLAHAGHAIKAPPQAKALLEQIVMMSDQKIESMSVDELGSMVRSLVNAEALKAMPDLQQIFLIYSAAPGTGKDKARAQFEENGKYADISARLILYHTRNPRKTDKDGVSFHFRTEKQLRALEKQGKIVTVWVNRQLQGMAVKDFVEEGISVDNVTGAEQFQTGDIVKAIVLNADKTISTITIERAGKNITLSSVSIALNTSGMLLAGDVITGRKENMLVINRPIKGLATLFSEGKPFVLEGGYNWFKLLAEKYPGVVSMFIAPFSNDDIQVRESSAAWIYENFNKPIDRRIAYDAMQKIIMENQGEINLMLPGKLGDQWRAAIHQAVEDDRNRQFNAELIESGAFIKDLNELLTLFNQPVLERSQYDEARALAYEIVRRIAAREGEFPFGRGKRPEYAVGETDPQNDRYNRVLEGVVQILMRHNYDNNRLNNYLGKVVENPWGYTEEAKKQIISNLTNDFTRFFFETIIAQVTVRVNNVSLSVETAQPETQRLVGQSI